MQWYKKYLMTIFVCLQLLTCLRSSETTQTFYLHLNLMFNYEHVVSVFYIEQQ
jgi:hypothetical protein